jgi:chromosomal replication initiation ATPase DnaA
MKTINIRKEELDRLADACCRVFEVNIDDFYSDSRRSKISDARKTYYHIIKYFYEINELEISQLVPIHRHRTTIMFSVDCANDYLKTDRYYTGKYSAVYELFTGRKFDGSINYERKVIKRKRPVQ